MTIKTFRHVLLALAAALMAGASLTISPAAAHSEDDRPTVGERLAQTAADDNDQSQLVRSSEDQLTVKADDRIGVSPPNGDRLGIAPNDDDRRFEPQPVGDPKGLTTGGGQRGGSSNCFIDFNNSISLAVLPDQAIDSVVEWPFYIRSCLINDIAIAVEPIGYDHYHLGYVDTDILWCLDLETFGKPDTPGDPTSCSPIDPLTEPRRGVSPHQAGFGIKVFAYDGDTGERVDFDLKTIRILSGEAEMCFVNTDLPWITSKPTDQHAGYCGDLVPGNWDVSADVDDVYEVRIWSKGPGLTFTDLGTHLD